MGQISGQDSGWRSRKLLDKMTDAFKPRYVKFCSPVKEKILSEGTHQKAKYCNYICSLSLNLKKEERKKKRKKHIYIYVLSTDHIADTVNMCVCVYIKKPCHILMSPHVEIYSLCCLPVKLSIACSLFSFVRLMLFSPKLYYSFL